MVEGAHPGRRQVHQAHPVRRDHQAHQGHQGRRPMVGARRQVRRVPRDR